MTVKITALQLVNFARVPSDLGMVLAPALQQYCNTFGITDHRRLRHFMATIAHECAGFKSMSEGLNYSVDGLMKTFSRARISAADCARFGRAPGRPAHQNAIANIVYGGPWGAKNLGNTEPGDGWRFRGRGLMMLTGRANYALMQRLTGLPLLANPDMAADPRHAALIACAWWKSKGLNEIADKDAGEGVAADIQKQILTYELDDMRGIRLRVNGGLLGLADVQNWLLRAGTVWR